VTISGGCNSNPLTVQNTPSDVVSVMQGPACWPQDKNMFEAVSIQPRIISEMLALLWRVQYGA